MRPSEESRKYLGQKEILGNKGFIDPAFEKEMKEEGWQTGWAWCMIFCRLVYMNCYPEKRDELKRLFTPSVLRTWKNMEDDAYPIGITPQIDSMVCWVMMKEGRKTVFGHAGIVTELNDAGFKSIEGNTAGLGVREGWTVAEHQHRPKENVDKRTGLKLMGFIQIPKPITLNL